ncbi:type VI secretion system contractile sheath large subunit [Pseudenhygromyxa sp. WMMC2535]|uniref:type VI secretion system contractile sheath large subunit n=1 Tax=Pseudenhygromyxa sp. WMMC2535 TaxID=2712867 RepID=UPI001557B796|nr:type VI secretion system contractile sheath large subunit [Pseudenhygromyxa sp. WMMC2535]NVB36776.1 type VI secretion system contractile sheath large subunit [Pseudenhygromyxa sp. WMMC2535]
MSSQDSATRDRVSLVYRDHETKEEKELPFKILVIGDYTGCEDERPLDERKPAKIDRQNLGAVMSGMGLHLRFNCQSKFSDDPEDTIPVDLRFSSFADFGPQWVAHQVPMLRELVESRRTLSEFKDWLRGSPSLVFRLKKALCAPETRAQLRRELSVGGQAEMLDWVIEGAEVGPHDAGYLELREGVSAYLRTRLTEFDDPDPEALAAAEREREAREAAKAAEPADLDAPDRLDGEQADAPPLAAPAPTPGSEEGAALLEDMLENAEVTPDTRVRAGVRLKPEQVLVDLAGVDLAIVEIDRLLGAQVDAILHHPDFQALESAWRSLRYLVASVNFRENCEIHLLNCPKQDLIDDFEDAPEIAKSGLYRLVYSIEYGTFGGEPYGIVVCDYEFDPYPVDMNLLANCAAVASMAHVPFLANASPRFFGEESFERLATYADVRSIFQGPQYTRWNSFRDSEDARYVGLCLPRFLLREPYGRQEVSNFNYAEHTPKKADYLWGHASFSFATCVARSFARYRWCPNIVGPTAGGAVEDLPALGFASMHGIETRMATEIQLTERHEYELSEEGFTGLVFLKAGDMGCFFSANSCQRPKTYANTDEGRGMSLGARLGAQLPYIFIVCRIAHYLKVLQREEIGRHLERGDMERELNLWLRQYISDMDNPAPAIRGKRPLRQAEIKVEEVPGQAGWYRAHLKLRPHLKYMGASFTLSLVGKLEREG